jgi:hypothetical protein
MIRRIGHPRITPRGTLLKGLCKDNVWSWRVKCRSKREFFDSVNDLIAKLEPHSEFLSELVLTGGDLCIIVNILGRANIGNVLSWQSMEKLARLKIDLGIEVFPDERKHANERKYCKSIT